MNDNEVLDKVRMTLADVHMDRPVDAIQQRGRSRRRARMLSGVAGGGLAVVVGAALAVPMLTGSTATPGTASAGGGPSRSVRLEPAAWSVELASSDTVVLTLRRPDFTDVGLLEKKLAEVNVPAFVSNADKCQVHGAMAPAKDVTVNTADDLGHWPVVYTIKPSAIPPGSHLIFTIYPGLRNQHKAPVPDNVYMAPAGTSVVCD